MFLLAAAATICESGEVGDVVGQYDRTNLSRVAPLWFGQHNGLGTMALEIWMGMNSRCSRDFFQYWFILRRWHVGGCWSINACLAQYLEESGIVETIIMVCARSVLGVIRTTFRTYLESSCVVRAGEYEDNFAQ